MFNWLIAPTLKRNHGAFKRQPASRASRPRAIFQLEELEGRLTPTVIPIYIANNTQESNPSSGLASEEIYVFFEAANEDKIQHPFNIDTTTGAATQSSDGFTPTLLSKLPTETLKYGTFSKITIDTTTYPNLYGSRLYFATSAKQEDCKKNDLTTCGGQYALIASDGVVRQFPHAKSKFYYDYVEFAYDVNTENGSHVRTLTADTTQIDQVGMPITLQLFPNDPLNTKGSGNIPTLDRKTMFDNYALAMSTDAKFEGYKGLLISNGDGGYYQILSPQNLIDSQLTTNSDGSGNGIQVNADIALGTGTPGNWTTTVTLVDGNNLQFKNGMQVQGPFIPAGSIVSGLPDQNDGSPGNGGIKNTFTLTSTLPANPFLEATKQPLFAYLAPTTALNSYFGPAVGQTANLNSGNSIDDFFDFWKSNPDKLLVENTSDPRRRDKASPFMPDSASFVYTGNVTTVNTKDINGVSSTYTVLQFTNTETNYLKATTSEVYNIYYPYFASNSPPGKTDPFGKNVPQPPHWWAGDAPRNSPSQMVFAANKVFADNGRQDEASYKGNSATLGSLENTIATALARGVGTTWQFGNGATFNPPGTSNKQQASWTLPKGAYDPIKDKISVGMNVTSWAINGVPMTISDITVDPTSGNATIIVKTTGTFAPGSFTDLLTFFRPYESGQTWSAYSKFMHNLIANPNPSPGGPDFYENFIDGHAYALPFDDNGGFSSTIASKTKVTDSSSLTITLSPWTPNGEMGVGTGSEVAVGSGQGSLPEVKIYDQNGAIVSRFMAYDAGFLGGVEVASGDLTRDGFPELITGAGPGGGPHVKIYDGKTGLLIRGFFAFDPGFTGGVSVATDDVNNDGFGDIIVGAGAGGGPRVCVFDGKTGAMIRSFFAYDSKFTGGVRVASGDTNQDSYSDIITGAGFGGGPNVKVFSGLDNTLLRSFFAYDSNLRNGVFVSAGDLDGDLYSEIFTGTGYGSSPQVKVFNPQTLAVVHDFYAYDLGFTGGVRVAAKDFNLDGQLDIITGSGKNGGPNVKVFDGNTLAVLDSFFAFPETFRGGVFVG